MRMRTMSEDTTCGSKGGVKAWKEHERERISDECGNRKV
jgi:hypothetical protein